MESDKIPLSSSDSQLPRGETCDLKRPTPPASQGDGEKDTKHLKEHKTNLKENNENSKAPPYFTVPDVNTVALIQRSKRPRSNDGNSKEGEPDKKSCNKDSPPQINPIRGAYSEPPSPHRAPTSDPSDANRRRRKDEERYGHAPRSLSFSSNEDERRGRRDHRSLQGTPSSNQRRRSRSRHKASSHRSASRSLTRTPQQMNLIQVPITGQGEGSIERNETSPEEKDNEIDESLLERLDRR